MRREARQLRLLARGDHAEGALSYKFAADCDDDSRAKVLAHAMKLPSVRKLEVWSGETLIYARPSAIADRQALRA